MVEVFNPDEGIPVAQIFRHNHVLGNAPRTANRTRPPRSPGRTTSVLQHRIETPKGTFLVNFPVNNYSHFFEVLGIELCTGKMPLLDHRNSGNSSTVDVPSSDILTPRIGNLNKQIATF